MTDLAQQLRTYVRKSKATADMGVQMFRAKINQLSSGTTLKMEGSLVGAWAEEAKSLVTSGPVPERPHRDLTDVSYIDSIGNNYLLG